MYHDACLCSMVLGLQSYRCPLTAAIHISWKNKSVSVRTPSTYRWMVEKQMRRRRWAQIYPFITLHQHNCKRGCAVLLKQKLAATNRTFRQNHKTGRHHNFYVILWFSDDHFVICDCPRVFHIYLSPYILYDNGRIHVGIKKCCFRLIFIGLVVTNN